MSTVIQALCHEHESNRRVLEVLDSEIAYLAEFKGRRRADYALVWNAIDYFTDFPALVHHPKEDLIFAQLRRADPAAALRIGDLTALHKALAEELRALAAELKPVMEDGKRPRDAMASLGRAFIRHQRQHMEMEEAVFFPVAERTLDAKAWAELAHGMTARLDPLIGGELSERFDALRRSIVGALAAQHPAAHRSGGA